MSVEDGEKNTVQDTIPLDYSEAPIKYIVSKIYSEKNGNNYISYGKGCYCGGMGLEEDELELSKEKNEICLF